MSFNDQSELIDVVAWAEMRPQIFTNHHLFHWVILYSKSRKLKLQAMIDSKSPYNLISKTSLLVRAYLKMIRTFFPLKI